MDRVIKFITFFFKKYNAYFIALLIAIILAIISRPNFFRNHALLERGIATEAEVTMIYPDIIFFGVKVVEYKFQAADGEFYEDHESVIPGDTIKIIKINQSHKIAIRYMADRPSANWLDNDHGYKLETYWEDRFRELFDLTGIFYIMILLMIMFSAPLDE